MTSFSFPALEQDDYSWTCRIVLPSWAGFQERQGAYGSLSAAETSDGTIELVIENADERDSPSPAQLAAYQHLIANESEIARAVLQAIFAAYPEMQENYDYDKDEKDEFMPDLVSADGLKNLIGLSSVHILDDDEDDISYVGFEFGCIWDEEHGLGVLTHRDNVLEVGAADTAF